MMAAKLFPTFDKLIMIFCKLLQNHILFNNTCTDKAKCDNWLSCLFQQHQHILWQLSAQFTPGKRFKELLTLVITLIIQIKDEKGRMKVLVHLEDSLDSMQQYYLERVYVLLPKGVIRLQTCWYTGARRWGDLSFFLVVIVVIGIMILPRLSVA